MTKLDDSTLSALCNAEVVAVDQVALGEQVVRDFWRQNELGTFEDAFEAAVGRHGVVFVRMRPGA